MQIRELTDSPTRTVAVVFETGEEPVPGLLEASKRLGLDGAHFTAIGAFQRVTVGWFDLDRKDYRRIEIDEQVEVLSLVGDLTLAQPTGEQPKVHAHVVVAGPDGRAMGGHLLAAIVRPTLEVLITDTPVALRRRDDPTTGLALIDLSSTEHAAMDDSSRGGSHGPNGR
jgi:predicted DNA-binding protein with PD1-like motif